MQTKVSLLLLSSILLLHNSYGDVVHVPETGNSTDAESTATTPAAVYESNVGPLNKDVSGFFPHLRLLILISQDFYPMFFTALGRGQKLFAHVIDDLDKTPNKTESLQIKLDELGNFIKAVDEISAAKYFHCYEYIGKLEEFIQKLDSLNATAMQNPSQEDLLINATLRKHGLAKMEDQFALAFGAYITVLSEELVKFEKILEHQQISNDVDLQKWVLEIKDIIKRIGAIVLFLESRNESAVGTQ